TSGMLGLITRGAVAAACLLPPTVLMGASFPAIARTLDETSKAASWLGGLYSANIAGAVAGCLIAGFYLLRVYDMAIATYIAAAINVTVALAALALGIRGTRGQTPRPTGPIARDEGPDPLSPSAGRAPGVALIYITIAVSGLTALGAEVVWTRLLSLLLGATVYTFSIILAVFLIGLWAGSTAGSLLVRRIRQPRLALAATQILLAAAIAETAYTLTYLLPYWPVD